MTAPTAPVPGAGTARSQDGSVPPKTTGDRVGGVLIVLGCMAVAVIGFTTSFEAVSTAMRPDFGPLAPLVPLGVDVGILVSSAAYISLTRRGEGHPLLRIVPHLLTAATVYLNVAAGKTVAGSIAHGVMVALWAVAVEVAAHVAKQRLGLDSGTRFDPIPVRRWLLDPLRTAALWRRMTLWNITEYRRALAYEKARRYAIGLCKAKYGRYRWRRRVSPLVKYEVSSGELPDEVTLAIDAVVDRGAAAGWKTAVQLWVDPAAAPAGPIDSITAEREHAPRPRADRPSAQAPAPAPASASASAPVPASAPAPRRAASRQALPRLLKVAADGETQADATDLRPTGRSRVRSYEELLPVARRLNDEHVAVKGREISVTALVQQLRISRPRATELHRMVREEAAAESAEAAAL